MGAASSRRGSCAFLCVKWQLTYMRMQARKKVNKLDNLTTGKAVDALLNYETVKLFNNEQFEVPHMRDIVSSHRPTLSFHISDMRPYDDCMQVESASGFQAMHRGSNGDAKGASGRGSPKT